MSENVSVSVKMEASVQEAMDDISNACLRARLSLCQAVKEVSFGMVSTLSEKDALESELHRSGLEVQSLRKRVAELEDDNRAFNKVSRIIAYEKENTELRKQLEALPRRRPVVKVQTQTPPHTEKGDDNKDAIKEVTEDISRVAQELSKANDELRKANEELCRANEELCMIKDENAMAHALEKETLTEEVRVLTQMLMKTRKKGS